MVEDVLRQVRAWLGPTRGERLVDALHACVEAQPGLQLILATPGVTSSPRVRPVLDLLIEHVRVTERI